MEENTVKKRSDTDAFASKRLLNTLYYQPEFFDDPQINEDLFLASNIKNVYRSLLYLKDNGIPFSRDALLQQFSLIDADASTSIVDMIVQPQNEKLQSISDIVIQLKDFRKRREASVKLKKAANDIESLSKIDESVLDIKDLIGEAEASLSLDDHNIKKVMKWGEALDIYQQELNSRRKGKQFWFHNFIFDGLVPDGPRPGEIGLITAASGTGKSTCALNLINDLISYNPPVSCMYFTLEMSLIATLDRLIALRLGIPYSSIAHPQADSGEFEDIIKRVEHERTELLENKLFRISEDSTLTLNELRRHIKKFQAEIGTNYCIIVLDLLSMVADFQRTKNGQNFAQSIEVGVNVLSSMAKELGVHFIGILQLNRSTEAEAGKIHDKKDLQKLKPNRAQIKNANAYLERARYVMTTHRELYYAQMYLDKSEWENDVDEIEVSCVKINNGMCKKIKGIFNGEMFTIDPLPDTEENSEDLTK